MYKLLLAAPVRHPFLTSAILAAGLASAAVIDPRLSSFGFGTRLPPFEISTGSVIQRAVLYTTPQDALPHLHHATALADVIGRAREWLSPQPEQPDENLEVDLAALPGSGPLEPHDFVSAGDPQPPIVIVPEIEPVAVRDEPISVAAATQVASGSPSDLSHRELFLAKGDDFLARGDLSGARLFFQRAADLGDARGAVGLGSTFDPKVLRALSVYGVRADPDQANYWYARARQLEMTSAGR
jgi:hypothetical protein